MNMSSNTSGTNTSITYLDDTNSSTQSNDDDNSISDANSCGRAKVFLNAELSELPSTSSAAGPTHNYSNLNEVASTSVNEIYNHQLGKFRSYTHCGSKTCEDVCIEICKSLKILPTTRLLFALREYNNAEAWLPPSRELQANIKYELRIRFKVPSLADSLYELDIQAFEYLYRQMRSDMVRESIPEIKYPLKKDNVVGMAVLDMYIDLQEGKEPVEKIEANYKRYLPRQLVKAHKVFVKPKICKSFRQFRTNWPGYEPVKLAYVREINNLAPAYLTETFTALVDYIPNVEHSDHSFEGRGNTSGNVVNGGCKEHMLIKLDLYDSLEPSVKVAMYSAADNPKWNVLSTIENIFGCSTDGRQYVDLEITGFRNNYRMQFSNIIHLESFISYLVGYIRLSSNWIFDMCGIYETPSLKNLKKIVCHGPIGGSYSCAKIQEKCDKCGSYIVRQCEKEYDIYYIDIITKVSRNTKKCKTETFKIKKESNSKWILFMNDKEDEFNSLTDLAKHIPTDESNNKFRIRPSPYDKPPLLLLCLPKNLQSKKTETELSENELQRKRVQILNPSTDLQCWYKKNYKQCDNGKMYKIRADWIQEGSFKDVPVSLKVLNDEKDFADFMKLAHTCSQINLPQFIKLFGITISSPYTMVFEYAKYGPLNEFLQNKKDKISFTSILHIVLGLVRGIVHLQKLDIIHGYIRCANMLVTKFDSKTNLLEAKIGDSGLPRPYQREDLAWIPIRYYRDLNAAKLDRNTDFWAFSTTIWELFSRGQSVSGITSETLMQNYKIYGGILPQVGDCPDEMYDTMMDGWSTDPEEHFNHQKIFQYINNAMPKYLSIDDPTDTTLSDASSIASSYHSEDEFDTSENVNQQHNGTADVRSSLSRTALSPSIRNNAHRRLIDHTNLVLPITNGQVICKNKIGEGHYGKVFIGEIRYNNEEREVVAIKTLLSDTQTQFTEDFRREIRIMKELHHPNIVKIKHWIEDPISIVMEYIKGGSFIVYLSTRKPDLTNEKLLDFALDIAKGMDYLCQHKVIHRDLAARNILVDRDSVKISDFGLAQNADQNGYYTTKTEREIPIKWYSPEAIEHQKFSFQSDVWSYGVTLFEMFSRGETPYLVPDKELDPHNFLMRLNRGERLKKPKLCSDIVYKELMNPCWHRFPKARPTFQQLIDKIEHIKTESGECI